MRIAIYWPMRSHGIGMAVRGASFSGDCSSDLCISNIFLAINFAVDICLDLLVYRVLVPIY